MALEPQEYEFGFPTFKREMESLEETAESSFVKGETPERDDVPERFESLHDQLYGFSTWLGFGIFDREREEREKGENWRSDLGGEGRTKIQSLHVSSARIISTIAGVISGVMNFNPTEKCDSESTAKIAESSAAKVEPQSKGVVFKKNALRRQHNSQRDDPGEELSRDQVEMRATLVECVFRIPQQPRFITALG